MASVVKNITANTAALELITTDMDDQAVILKVTAASDLGGGTLNFAILPFGADIDPEKIDTAITLAAGSEGKYHVGTNMKVFAILAGATNPVINIIAASVR